MIAIGQSLGAVFGPGIAEKGAGDVFMLLLVSAGIFAVCLLLYNVINSRVRREHAEEEGFADEAEKPLEKGGGFQLVLTNRYLLLIACMVLVSNLVNTTGEYILSNAALTHAEEQVPGLPASAEAAVSAKAEQAVQQGRAANLQVALSAPGARYCELPVPVGGLDHGVVRGLSLDSEGLVHPLPGPGLGMEVDLEAVRAARVG